MKLQLISVPAGNFETVSCVVLTDDPDQTLDGATVVLKFYEQKSGAPYGDPVIHKSSETPGGITILPSPPMSFTVNLEPEDTADLLGNYFMECTLYDIANNPVTVICGLMTVLQTLNGLTP